MDDTVLHVDWPDLTNDVTEPLPWWCGVRSVVHDDVSEQDHVQLHPPGLPGWVTAHVDATVDVPTWLATLAGRGIAAAGVGLGWAGSTTTGARKYDDYLSIGIAVPPSVCADPDAARVAAWLRDAVLDAVDAASRTRKVPAPTRRPPTSPRREMFHVGSALDLTGPRIADLPRLLATSSGLLVPARHRDDPRLARSVVVGPTEGPGGALVAAVAPVAGLRERVGAWLRSGRPPAHYDFRGVDHPMLLADVLGRDSTVALAWSAGGDPLDGTRPQLGSTLELIASGSDGEVGWSLFGWPGRGRLLERHRVDVLTPSDDEDEDEDEDEDDGFDGRELVELDATTAPRTVRLDPDEFHARHVGRCGDRQFFLSESFTDGPLPDDRRSYLALYTFDLDGVLLGADIHELTDDVDDDALERSLLAGLGPREPAPIVVVPFTVDRDGVRFGFEAVFDDVEWTVRVVPGDSMAFHAPWDFGIYDT